MATSKYELPDETLQLIANSDFANAFKSFNQNVTPSQSAGALKPDNLIKALRDATKAGPGNPGVNLLANRANGKPLQTRDYKNQLFYPQILKMGPYIKPDVVLPKAETQLPYVPPFVPPIVDDVVIKKLGDDVVSDDDDVDTGVATTIVGGTGNDTIVGGTGNDDVADDGTTTDIQDVIDGLNLNTVLADTTSILNNISDGKDKDGYVDITGLDGTTVTHGPLNLTTAFDSLGDTTSKNGVVTITDAKGETNTGSVNTSLDKAEDTSTSLPNVITQDSDVQDDGTTDGILNLINADLAKNVVSDAQDDGTTKGIDNQISSQNLVQDYQNDLGLYLTNVADSIYGPTANLAYSPNPFATPTYGTSNGVAGGGSAKPYDDWSSAAYAKGGKVTPDRLMGPDPAGPDDGYAALKSGEFVLNEKSAKEIGYEVLKRLNARNR